MVEVNIPEQEPEPDIRPSSRQSLATTYPEPQPQEAQAFPYTNKQQDRVESFSDEHAVRYSPDTLANVDQDDLATTTRDTHSQTPSLIEKPYNDNVHDAQLPLPHSRPDSVDQPPAQKSNTSAPMKSILQGVTSRFTSYPNQHRLKNNIHGGNVVSQSSPDLSRVDEKDYGYGTNPSGTTHFLGLKKGLYKSSSASATKNDLHARFNLSKDHRQSSPLGLGRGGPAGNGNHENVGHTVNNGMEDAAAAIPTGAIGMVGPIRPTKSMAELLVPDRKLGSDPTWSESLKNTVKSSYIVYLLPLVPVAWALHFSHQSDVIVFVFSFLAVIPLASLLSFATEQLALRTGDALGGLLNATFGNAVELLISILALVKGEIGLVQASMIGSILSNTLLVLGCCFLAGGLRFHEQIYSTSATQLQISLLGIAMCALVLPAAFQFSLSSLSTTVATRPIEEITDLDSSQRATLLSISRGVSFMLLSTYAVYLVFQLYTHAYLFKRRPQANKRPHHEPGEPHPNHEKVIPINEWVAAVRSRGSASSSSDGLTPTTTRDTTLMHTNTIDGTTGNSTAIDVELGGTAPPSIRDNRSMLEFGTDDDEEEEEKPLVKAIFALVLLLAVTGITGVTAEFLVSSINGVTESTSMSPEFVGMILLPIVGNVPEHVCAVTVSIKDKLDLSLSIAVGSTIQVALGILPLLVLIGWAMGQPMSLFFDAFQIISLAVSLIIVQFAISDGRSCFAEGYILIMTYCIFALCSWYYDPSKII